MQRTVSVLVLSCWLVSLVSAQSIIPVRAELLEEVRKEAALIREESQKLKTLLMLSEADCLSLQSQLMTVEQELIIVSQRLEQSGEDLIQLQQDLMRLKYELTALKRAAEESNSLLKKSKREARTWQVIAISGLALGLAGVIWGIAK